MADRAGRLGGTVGEKGREQRLGHAGSSPPLWPRQGSWRGFTKGGRSWSPCYASSHIQTIWLSDPSHRQAPYMSDGPSGQWNVGCSFEKPRSAELFTNRSVSATAQGVQWNGHDRDKPPTRSHRLHLHRTWPYRTTKDGQHAASQQRRPIRLHVI